MWLVKDEELDATCNENMHFQVGYARKYATTFEEDIKKSVKDFEIECLADDISLSQEDYEQGYRVAKRMLFRS